MGGILVWGSGALNFGWALGVRAGVSFVWEIFI